MFREAFTRVGLPYYSPHSFCKTLAVLGERVCPNAEALKAWSQNLGHEAAMTTLTSYGAVSSARQAEIIRSLTANTTSAVDTISQIKALVAKLSPNSVRGGP